ncbi:glycoside hydrolase family 64 protein [Paenibacillus sp. MMS20-IR301]|uniref:glycoside hydrolase family 64 protein n=1 Tax=Paenibacillus sp. MMS20-IR301 TaxID=2895946 RepID=UPI0028E2C8F5|nr:glycoside hydrolase family 64 protein [Paenibacillus sp. MMS20-IR301]WNS45407.1 glycoside hydrolase family 64 protein [Paenibacillus sp. MMS20-IR301]
MRKRWLMSMLAFVLLLLCLPMFGSKAAAADYTQGVDLSGSTATLWFKSTVSTSWVDVHYKVNSGTQLDYRMTYNNVKSRYEQTVTGVPGGTALTYFFTYNNGTPAYDTGWFTYTAGTAPTTPPSGTSASIYSITASSIPAAPAGSLSLKIMNGTSGAYSDSQVYWGILGINPANGKWSYLDLNGNLLPISNALNDASGHLTKNGVNYANVYHTVSQASWVNLPKITSGRMFLSVGTPLYIKTYDDGFAGPDFNNTSDPNRNIYFDFVEFTVDATGYHGNTTRVDGFGFPIQHRLVSLSGGYDKTVGEFESETRAGLFTKYQNEVPAAFKSLATDQAPYRIIAPIHGSFKAGGANANYFAGYSSYNTQDILRCDGALTDAATAAAINRHVYTTSNWNNVANYYNAAPANYYAKFWHDHSISGLAYGFPYDDVNGQAAYLEVGDPKGLIIRVAW